MSNSLPEEISVEESGRRESCARATFVGSSFRRDSRPPTSKLDGLYALTDRKEVCLLPFLDWGQTQQVIHAIENKFPGLAEGWRSEQAIEEHARAEGAT